jgi:hypothetical protein
MVTIQQFIGDAYRDHAADPTAVATRLADGFALLPTAPDQAEAFVRLAEHVVLGHLADAAQLDQWIAQLEPLAATGDDGFSVALARARLANALSRGAIMSSQEALPVAGQVRAYGSALLAMTRRAAWAEIRSGLTSALQLTEVGGDDASLRSFGAVTNNLAGDLRFYSTAHRNDAEYAELMIDAARLAYTAWYRAGSWLERERADYQLALCLAAVGVAEEAIAAADACWRGCIDNGADDEECFYALEAVAHARCAAGQLAEARRDQSEMIERMARWDGQSRSSAAPQVAAVADAIKALETEVAYGLPLDEFETH